MGQSIFSKLSVATIAGAALSFGAILTSSSVQAATITSNFSSSLNYSSGDKVSFLGQFSFNDSALTGIGDESVSLSKLELESSDGIKIPTDRDQLEAEYFSAKFVQGNLTGIQGSDLVLSYSFGEYLSYLITFNIPNEEPNKFSFPRRRVAAVTFNNYTFDPYNYASVPHISVPEPGAAPGLVGLGVIGLAGLLRKNSIFKSY